jgi:hypothetical protein
MEGYIYIIIIIIMKIIIIIGGGGGGFNRLSSIFNKEQVTFLNP